MAIERTCTRAVPKPWGDTDLRPWSSRPANGPAIGEIWFQRADASAPDSALLLKLLFTTEPLSIQVHPDDTFARSIGLAHGKAEAWYVLSALPDARVALGLKRPLSKAQLRTSIDEGSIEELVQWRSVRREDTIFVSPGLIHAIGPGLTILEIQQRSDVTFRLFDYGRQRELQVESAIAAANSEQAAHRVPPVRKLSPARTLLLLSPQFVLEHFALPPGSGWELLAAHETWLFVLDGGARIGPIDAGMGEAIFLDAAHTTVQAGAAGLKGLMAYVGSAPAPDLLRELDDAGSLMPIPMPMPTRARA